jgi:hypothetical protein
LENNMTSSSLDPDNLTSGPDRSLGKGHGTGALGPSDTSDSGSDISGGPGLGLQLGFEPEPDTETGEDGISDSAGPDLGDSDLDSDTDSSGTGERAAATRDTVRDGADIDVDRIIDIGALEPEKNDDDRDR